MLGTLGHFFHQVAIDKLDSLVIQQFPESVVIINRHTVEIRSQRGDDRRTRRLRWR